MRSLRTRDTRASASASKRPVKPRSASSHRAEPSAVLAAAFAAGGPALVMLDRPSGKPIGAGWLDAAWRRIPFLYTAAWLSYSVPCSGRFPVGGCRGYGKRGAAPRPPASICTRSVKGNAPSTASARPSPVSERRRRLRLPAAYHIDPSTALRTSTLLARGGCRLSGFCWSIALWETQGPRADALSSKWRWL